MKVIGIGETVLDIVFDSQDRPVSAKPGGSVYNALISIARSGHEATLISEVGDDHVGRMIRGFLRSNGVGDDDVAVYGGSRSPLALAFLDKDKNAQYQFYKDYPAQRLDFAMPTVERGDILLFGSYFALNPAIRRQVLQVLRAGREGGALLFYDLNFRSTHNGEAAALRPTLEENMRLAHVVKGSDEDIRNAFGTGDWRKAYAENISALCPYFICTQGAGGATLLSPYGESHVGALPISPVSTIGAGDSFNAGTVCGLLDAGVSARDTASAAFAQTLARAMAKGRDFSAEVCQSLDNYIAPRH